MRQHPSIAARPGRADRAMTAPASTGARVWRASRLHRHGGPLTLRAPPGRARTPAGW